MYIKYLKYILLPSGNIYKIDSYCRIENFESFINDNIENDICTVIYSDSKPLLMFFNEPLFDLALQSENSHDNLTELIMLMKKIETKGGEIIKI